MGTRKKMSKNDILDDLLDNSLLSDDSPRRPKPGLTGKPQAVKPTKPGEKDDFYSSLAAMATSDAESDKSEVDMDKLVHSLGGLDDMDADLFGDKLNKKSNANKTPGKPTTPRRVGPKAVGNKSPTRVQSPTRSDPYTSPPESARSLKRKPVKPPPSSATQQPSNTSLPQTQVEHKPGTAPGKMTDLSAASESLKPGQKTVQRPETAPKLKNKFDLDFDPDDPLAGILSDETDDISESDRPRSATKKPAAVTNPPPAVVKPQENTAKVTESPRRRNLMDRPPTRSGGSDNTDSASPGIAKSANLEATKPGAKTAGGIFSDSDNDLLELEGRTSTPAQKPKSADSEDQRPARSVLDSLLGKTSGASALLEPKEKKPFVLDNKYSSSVQGETAGGKEDDDGFSFGNYQPSAASGSRPNSRRSVRFQDDDDIFGLDSRPSPRTKSPGSRNKASLDMDWLELASSNPATATSTSSTPGTAAAVSTTVASSTKPPVPTTAVTTKPPDSPKKSPVATSQQASAAKLPPTNTGQSPKAWLGLADSESDDELFKPKKSSVRSASLPQSPIVSATASPRVVHKKPTKKDTSPKPGSSVSENKEEEDDWLAKVKSQRQQVLAKEKSEETGRSSDQVDGDVHKSTFNKVNVDVSQMFINTQANALNDLLSPPAQPKSAGGPSWESPRTQLSYTVRGGQTSGSNVGAVTNQSSTIDPRLKFSASLLNQDQAQSNSAALSPSLPQTVVQQAVSQAPLQLDQPSHPSYPPQYQQSQQPTPLQPQLQQQLEQLQFMQQQEMHKSELLKKQQELQKMMQDVQKQYDSISRTKPLVQSSQWIPSFTQITSSIELPDSLPEAHAKIRKLELERTYTESLLDSLKRRYEEEMFTVESSYKNRLQILEESNRKKEIRLREENEELMQQHLNKVRQLEQEKSDQSTAHYRKLEDMEREKAQELEKLKEQNRLTLASLKRDHEEALDRLVSAKNQEINKIANANDTSRSLTVVVEQISNNAKDLNDLQRKVEAWNKQGLDEREITLRSKDEQLQMLQERLKRQEEDNERERKRLEELIVRMESQLREQTRLMEEERWKLKQDQSRAEAVQRSLDEERRLWLEQQTRERMSLERARDNLLEEQHSCASQITDERRLLAEERAKFQIEQKTVREKLHQDTIKRTQAEAEYEVLMKAIAEEKVQQASRLKELQREEERINSERNKLERERAQIDQEREMLAKQARQIREQSEEIDRVTEAARRAQNEGEQAMEEAFHVSSQIERRETDIEKKLSAIKLMEEHITEEKLRLAREKKEMDNLRKSHLCVNCRSPQNGLATLPLLPQNGYHTPLAVTAPQFMIPSPGHQMVTNPLEQIAASIASDRAVRMLKIQAIKDKEFLEEENFYLETLRHTPYHSTASKS
uniref:Fas-binding factor 1 C-terminal domain-containing protein n=1 Tax=Biomphalaria glabrata TaxID=6526 RepID=A0A2C9LKY0_BIOGL